MLNPLDPVKWWLSTTLKIGSTAYRTVELLLGRNAEDDAEHRYRPVATPMGGGEPRGDRPRGDRPTASTPPARSAPPARPEPTSAAGASGGVAGTADAPGDAAAAGAPDPTAPAIPRGERKPTDVAPPTPEDRFKRDSDEDEDELVETEGAAAPSATLRVGEPFKGYDKLKAPEIVARVRESDEAVKAVVRLYESTHKRRKSILTATEA